VKIKREIEREIEHANLRREFQRIALAEASLQPKHLPSQHLDEIADRFGLSKAQLAETAGFAPETFYRKARSTAPKTQSRVKEMLEIIRRVADWAGGEQQAMAWYRAYPIPSFGGRTAESLVKTGKATAVRDYLDDVALGGFA
jgi:uncharacterized protein (DUF2384 family)